MRIISRVTGADGSLVCDSRALSIIVSALLLVPISREDDLYVVCIRALLSDLLIVVEATARLATIRRADRRLVL